MTKTKKIYETGYIAEGALHPSYIGQTVSPLEERLKGHLTGAKKGNSERDKWIRSLEKVPEIRLIRKVPYAELSNHEGFWIMYYFNKNIPLVNGLTPQFQMSPEYHKLYFSKETVIHAGRDTVTSE